MNRVTAALVAARAGSMSLIAICVPSERCLARQTAPIPPSPSLLSRRNRLTRTSPDWKMRFGAAAMVCKYSTAEARGAASRRSFANALRQAGTPRASRARERFACRELPFSPTRVELVWVVARPRLGRQTWRGGLGEIVESDDDDDGLIPTDGGRFEILSTVHRAAAVEQDVRFFDAGVGRRVGVFLGPHANAIA